MVHYILKFAENAGSGTSVEDAKGRSPDPLHIPHPLHSHHLSLSPSFPSIPLPFPLSPTFMFTLTFCLALRSSWTATSI